MNPYTQEIFNLLDAEKLNKRLSDSIAAKYGIVDKTIQKELTELAIVLKAREIANVPGTILEKYRKIVNLYQNQVNLSHRTSQSIMLQQYSTPAPIGFIAGAYVLQNQPKDYQIFEPSAGNGLLTVAFDPKNVVVNEVDENRYNNLKSQPFMQVLRIDGTKDLARELEFDSLFDGIITNPPFGTLDTPFVIGEYRINHLDHLMAIRVLDCMKDTGRAAIIIGGHTNYDDKGRVQSGKNRIFLTYLYSHYNVDDIINIDGSLYSRQGTSFDVRLILINGRKQKPAGFPPLKNQDADSVNDFDTLFERVVSHFNSGQRRDNGGTTDKNKVLIAKAKAKALLLIQAQKLNGINKKTTMKTTNKIIQIAKTCHEANKAFCESINDFSQSTWDKAPDWQKESAINGVIYHLQNPNSKPCDSHNIWMKEKVDNGWVYGKEKDPVKKTHPCIVPYEQLPKHQQFKDALFISIVRSFK